VNRGSRRRLSTAPAWPPLAVQLIARELSADFRHSEDQALLAALLDDPRMVRVSTELYRHRNLAGGSLEYFNPAIIRPITVASHLRDEVGKLKLQPSNKKARRILELEIKHLERLRPKRFDFEEQDQGVQILFRKVFLECRTPTPVHWKAIAADVDEWRSLAIELRRYAGLLDHAAPTEARRLRTLADDCDENAAGLIPPPDSDPWIIVRGRGDVLERSVVISIWMICRSIFKKDLFSTVGTLAAVVMKRPGHIPRSRVREIIRSIEARNFS
jgi:hypothetical protein